MLKISFMTGMGLGLIAGMFLVKMCPKAEKAVEDIKSMAENKVCKCGCQNDQNEQNGQDNQGQESEQNGQ